MVFLSRRETGGGLGCSSVARVFAQHAESPGFDPQHQYKLGVVMHAHLQSWHQEAEARSSKSSQCAEFKASLSYVRP